MAGLEPKIRGVNLGNWLVLERWMNPAMFADTEALDEYHLPRMLPEAAYRERIRTHRNEYITERDFTRIPPGASISCASPCRISFSATWNLSSAVLKSWIKR